MGEEHRRRRLLLLPLLFVLVFLAEVEAPLPLPAASGTSSASTSLFVLGDSSVNCGDNNPFGFLCPKFQFPLCNASFYRHLPDLIAERMGLQPVPEYFSTSTKSAAELASGVNFGSTPGTILSARAIADAVGFNQSFASLFFLQTLGRQVLQLSETLQHIRLDLGPSAAGRVASSALFLLSFGNDDYVVLLGADRNATAAQPKYGPRLSADILVSNMIRAVRELYNEDVRRMAVMGLGPLGSAPFALSPDRNQVNEIVSDYNERLSAKLMNLRSELPGAEIVFCDIYRGMMEIISNPADYGFENVRNACCSFIDCLDKETACSEPQKHIWWDMHNPTLAVNTLLASWSWSGSTMRICEPLSLHQLTALG